MLTGGTYTGATGGTGGTGAIGVIGAGAKLPDESKTILSPLRLVVVPSAATVNGPCPVACAKAIASAGVLKRVG